MDLQELPGPLLPSTNWTEEELLEMYWKRTDEYQIRQQLLTYLPPIFIIFGIMGNAVCCVVINKSGMRGEATRFYLATLCLVNVLILFMGCGLHWFSHITNSQHVAMLTDWMCRVWQCFFNILLYSSSWVVVAMLVERYVYTYHPKVRSTLCSLYAAKVSILIICVGLLCVAVHALWTYELTRDGCYVDHSLHSFHTKFWPWFSAFVYIYLPVVTITVFDILLLCAFLPSDCHRSRISQASEQNGTLTKVSLLISFVHLTLSLPTIILNLIDYWVPSLRQSPMPISRLLLALSVCQILSCLNHSTTFMVTYIMLPALRKDTTQCLSHACKRLNQPQHYQLTPIEISTEEIGQDTSENSHVTVL